MKYGSHSDMSYGGGGVMPDKGHRAKSPGVKAKKGAPTASWKGAGAHVKGSRLPNDGGKRKGMKY